MSYINIKNLKDKPENVRKRMLAISLVVAMSLVALVWVYDLGYRFNGGNQQVASNTEDDTIKPFKLFANSISSTFGNISASVGNISMHKNTTESTPTSKQINLIPIDPATNQPAN